MKRNLLSLNLLALIGAVSFANPLRAQEQVDAADGISLDSLQGIESYSLDEDGNLVLILFKYQ